MKTNKFPSWIILEITDKCNFSCKHCYLSAKKTGKNITMSLITKIKKELKNKKLDILAITGGEPLLHKNLKNIVSVLAPLVSKMIIETNLSLVNNNFISFIKKYRKKIIIQTSIEGLKTHTNIRSYSLENIINKLKKLRNEGIKTGVLFTVSIFNEKELIPTKNYFQKKVDFFSVERLIPIGRGKNIPNLDKKSFSKILNKCIKEGIFCSDPLKVIFEKQDKNFVGCSAGIFACCIDNYGNLFPCPKLRIKCGNIKKSKISEIWQNSEILKDLRMREKKLKGKCSKCKFINSCGGCRAYAFAIKNDWLEEDPLCPK